MSKHLMVATDPVKPKRMLQTCVDQNINFLYMDKVDDVKQHLKTAQVQDRSIIMKIPQLSKKVKFCCYLGLISGIILIVLGCFVPMLVSNMIHDKIEAKVVMTAANQQLWGELPGESKIDVYRNVTFYEFQNPMDVVFRGARPKFLETKGYDLFMRQKFLNSTFSEGEVSYNRYTYYEKIETQNSVLKVTTVNPGALGIWNVVKTLNSSDLALNSLGALVQNVMEQVSLNIYYQGMRYNLLTTYTKAIPVLSGVQDQDKRQIIWNDTYYGLSTQNTMEYWIRAANEGEDFGSSSNTLRDYFQLTEQEMAGINRQMRTLMGALNQTAYKYYGCNAEGSSNKTQKYDCDGLYFAALQFSSQGVSRNPPPGMGIPVIESIVSYNDSLHDYPEINYFYEKEFLINIDGTAQYEGLHFDIDWMYAFLARNFDFPNSPPIQDESILQHRANVRFIYETGQKFDKSKNLNDFTEFMARFKLPSVQHSRVLWEWVKQIENKFAKRTNLHGNQQDVGMATFGTQALYWSFQNLTNYLLPTLVSASVLANQQWSNCDEMLKASLDDLTDPQITSICSIPEFSNINELTIKYLLEVCDAQYSDKWQAFKTVSGFTRFQMLQFCADGTSDQSFQTFISNSHSQMKTLYSCRFERCSKIELALKQWSRSQITLNPPVDSKLPSSTSVHFWNSEKFTKAFEYGHFAVEFADIFTYPIIKMNNSYPPQILSDEDAKNLINFRRLFNTLSVTTAFVLARADFKQEFQDKFIFKEYENLLQYIRYITLELGFGGITMNRSPEEILFGYKDERVDQIGQMDPAGGGDPSKLSWIKMGDANMTLDDAIDFPQIMKTGSKKLDDTRHFVSLQGQVHASFNNTVFDGNKSFQQWQNPWQVQLPVAGASDGIINSPFRNHDSALSIYVPQVFRSLEFSPSEGQDFFGLSTIRYDMNPTQQPSNYDMYFNRWAGTHNLSRPYNAPVIVTQPHFVDSDPRVQGLVDFVDSNNNIVEGSKWDRSFQNVEPYTGVPLQAVIQLMVTLEMDQDGMFTRYPYALLPVLTLWNSGNFTESAAQEQFGDLITGLKVQNIGLIVLIVLGSVLFMIGLAIIITFQIRKRQYQEKIKKGISFQDGSSQDTFIQVQPESI